MRDGCFALVQQEAKGEWLDGWMDGRKENRGQSERVRQCACGLLFFVVNKLFKV